MTPRGSTAGRRPHVALVEDDRSLASLVSFTLETAGMRVCTETDGRRALTLLDDHEPDLVILDLMLPSLDGFQVCRHVRERSRVPIVMLTARTDTGDVVRGLELGADDYVTKPFEAPELLARVRAALRRSPAGHDSTLQVGCLRLDPNALAAHRDDQPLDLSVTEFRLLYEFARHPGQVLTRESLLRRVWGYDYLGDSRLVDMAVRRVRSKLQDDAAAPRWVETVRGVGYRFVAS